MDPAEESLQSRDAVTHETSRRHQQVGRRTRTIDLCITYLDSLLVSTFIAPLIVMHWRGIWILLDVYLYPDDNLHNSAVASLSLGLAGHFVFTMLQDHLATWFNPGVGKLNYYIGSRVYTALYGFVCINAWRGMWYLLDIYTGTDICTLIVSTVAGIVALASMRCLCNVSAPPFVMSNDRPAGYFKVNFRFYRDTHQGTCSTILNALFGIVIVGSLNLLVWRSIWTLINVAVNPDDLITSALTSLFAGYAITIASYCMQPWMKKIHTETDGFSRIAFEDFYYLFALIGTVNFWRGVWYVCDAFFPPNCALLSNWLSTVVSLLVLIAINCSNSILLRGVYVDGDDALFTDGVENSLVFSWSYLRVYVDVWEARKGKSCGVPPGASGRDVGLLETA